jgi:hypothetical protein
MSYEKYKENFMKRMPSARGHARPLTKTDYNKFEKLRGRPPAPSTSLETLMKTNIDPDKYRKSVTANRSTRGIKKTKGYKGGY